MTWHAWYLIPYLAVGLLVGRVVRIRLGRRRKAHKERVLKHHEAWEERKTHRSGYGDVTWCHRGCEDQWGDAVGWWTFWSILLWPIAAWYFLVYYGGLGLGLVLKYFFLGIFAFFDLLFQTPPVTWAVRFNRWFWQDPQDRKKNRAGAA